MVHSRIWAALRMLLAGRYNAIANGAGRGVIRRYRHHDAFLSGAHDMSRHGTVQLDTVAGRNALPEGGLLAGLWYRF